MEDWKGGRVEGGDKEWPWTDFEQRWIRAGSIYIPGEVGRVKEIRVPLPGSLWAEIWPPWAATRLLAMARPRPLPCESSVL
jgi:hypothetical protein